MKWRLIKFVGDDAILANEDGKEVAWPHSLLPRDYKIGDEFTINFAKPTEIPPKSDEAKHIINTLLKSK